MNQSNTAQQVLLHLAASNLIKAAIKWALKKRTALLDLLERLKIRASTIDPEQSVTLEQCRGTEKSEYQNIRTSEHYR